MREHGAALAVFFIPGYISVLVDDRDRLARLAADGDRVDAQAGVAQVRGGLQSVALLVFAVGDEQHRARRRAASAAVEDALRFQQRRGDGRPLLRHPGGIDRAQEKPRRGVVRGERALHEGVAREDHQAHAIALEPIEERGDFQLGAVETRGLHVARQHAVRGVERDDEVDARALHELRPLAALRTRRGQKKKEEPEPQRRAARDALRRPRSLQDVAEAQRGNESCDLLLPLPCAHRRERSEQEPERRQPEEEGRDDAQVLPEEGGLDAAHGAPESRELRSARPISPKSAAGKKKRAYHSS